MSYPGNPAPIIEVVSPDLTLEWLYDRRIVVFKITAAQPSRTATDAWAASVKETLDQWPRNRIWLSLHEFLQPSASFTPYVRQRSAETRLHAPDVVGHSVLVVKGGFVMSLFQAFLRTQKVSRPTHIFNNREDGLRWLKSKMRPDGENPK